ncbi:MAG TPA: energy transducer TonB [Desulfobacteraceae bacterium]|nr:energy transducer TonB [Desulfobacteraceae bacterium]
MDDIDTLSRNRSGLPENGGDNKKKGLALYFVSLCLHFCFLALLFFVQDMTPDRVIPPAISVDLVSLPSVEQTNATQPVPETDSSAFQPEPEPSPPPEKKAETRAPQKPPEPDVIVAPEKSQDKGVVVEKEPEPEKEPVITSAPGLKQKPKDLDKLRPAKKENKKEEKKEKKSSLKKKTYKPQRVLESAREHLEKQVEEKKKNTLTDALERLRSKVDSGGGKKRGISASAEASSGSEAREPGAIDLYNIELMYRIQQNWVFNERLARAAKDSEVRILIKILKNGRIRDIWFETRSGNNYLDDSAYKAVQKSNPLPPLPKGYSSYDVGLIFTPSGLK